jgi:predicted nucleic acid-binding protein
VRRYVLDANVVYSSLLRDVLIRLALRGALELRFSERILDETFGNLAVNRPDLSSTRLERTRRLLATFADEVVVTGYEHRAEDLDLPDPDDRHVLAAAIECGADGIVTFNLDDFPAAVTTEWGIEVLHPDVLLAALHDAEPSEVCDVLAKIARDTHKPHLEPAQLVDALDKLGLPRSAGRLRNDAEHGG